MFDETEDLAPEPENSGFEGREDDDPNDDAANAEAGDADEGSAPEGPSSGRPSSGTPPAEAPMFTRPSQRRDPGPMGSEGMRTELLRPDAMQGESWDEALPNLREAYPAATDGVLFCVYKLLQDRDTTMRDFRDEAMTRGVGLSGRSMHSAKVLLGLAEPATRKPKKPAAVEPDDDEPPRAQPQPQPRRAAPEPVARRRPVPRDSERRADSATNVEEALRNAVQQMQDAAEAENERLRHAIRDAVEILRQALGD